MTLVINLMTASDILWIFVCCGDRRAVARCDGSNGGFFVISHTNFVIIFEMERSRDDISLSNEPL